MKMKLLMGVLFVTLAVSGVLALPARTEDAEVIGGPRSVSAQGGNDDNNHFPNFEGVIGTDSGYPLLPTPAIRIGFFDDFIRRFTEHFFSQSFFSRGSVNSDDSASEVSIPAIDPKKANITSTVKVVDGHKVEVNETVYGDDNNVYRVRVVNVRPLEEGETVEETEINNIHPATQGPVEKAPANESNESDETREPLEKKTSENEIEGNIDEPEHSIGEKENIVETERTTATIDTTMLPTTGDINAAFVTESCLEQQEYSTTAVAEEELNGASGNGNNEFETNMSEGNNNNNNNNNNNENNNNGNDNIDNVENVEVEQTIENNEDTGKEANDNLNESSSSSNVDVSDNEQKTNENNDDVVENGNEAKADSSNILDALRNQELIEVSDDDDTNSSSSAIYATLDDEWSNLSLPTNEKNDLSNDIDLDNSLPIDLSNDIAVNYASNLPHNPDAELINAKYIQQSLKDVPIFPEGPLGLQSLAKPAK